jgi:hypothetical protein
MWDSQETLVDLARCLNSSGILNREEREMKMDHVQALKDAQREVFSFDWNKIKTPTAEDFREAYLHQKALQRKSRRTVQNNGGARCKG